MMKVNLFFLVLLLAFSASAQKVQTAFIIPEKDLIPEGITYDAQSKSFFVSSIFKNKIVRIDADKKITDFISSKQDDIGQVLGMKVADGKLWAASNLSSESGGSSMVHQYDLASGKLIRKWILSFSTEKHLFNDLAIHHGVAFISDSDDGSVFRVSAQLDKPELFSKDNKLRDINGIAMMNDQNIVVNASTGFFLINIQSKEIIRLPFESYYPLGIDGLCKYKQSLVGIQNVVFPTSINQYFLNEKSDKIINAKALLSNHPQFKIPTTGVIVDDWFYFIANSQLSNIEGDRIKDPSTLRDVVILKIGLK